jgi:spore coat protein H
MRPHHLLLTAVALAVMAHPTFAQKKDPTVDFFKPTGPVPVVKVSIDKEHLRALMQDPRKYERAQTIQIGDKTFTEVGIHMKGAAGSFRGWNDKPGLTLNFNKFKEGQDFLGLDKIHLNNAVQDGSMMHELLVYEMALAMGIPACRCTHVLVELNGKKVGLYVFKEGFDKPWLERHFKDKKGNLYDGGFLTDLNGELKLSSGTDVQRKDLKAIVKACSEGDKNKRYEAVSKLVDVDKFCTNAAIQIIGGDWDGYIRKPNNYRIYFPTEGKAVFIPHGMDQMWQNPGEGLWHGWGGIVARAILDHPEGKKKTVENLKVLMEKHFTVEKIHKRIDELAPRAKEALTTVNKDWANWFDGETKGLKERIKQRVALVKQELPKLEK